MFQQAALTVAIHTLSNQNRDFFRQEIAGSVADPTEVESELRCLAVLMKK